MIILQQRIYRADLRANPSLLYVFGDNEARVGLGGQAAEMRGEPNARGIATLRAPGVFWSEADNARQCEVVMSDFCPLFEAVNASQSIALPLDGVGTGLAHLRERAPSTFSYLERLWAKLIEMGQQ